jgi:hypothetical protein
MTKARFWDQEEEDWIIDNILYCPETGHLRYKSNYAEIKPKCKSSYVRVCRLVGGRGVCYLGHRVAWFLHYKKQTSLFIDHINRVPSDNRILNLREASYHQNIANKTPKKKGLKIKGVTKVVKYEVFLQGKSLGLYNCKIEAAKVYDEAAFNAFGEFALLNKNLGVYK